MRTRWEWQNKYYESIAGLLPIAQGELVVIG